MLKHKTLSEGVSAPPSRRKATLIQALGGYVNTGILIVQGLLLIPLYLYHIGAHTYGLWLASGGILGMMSLMNFGISSMLIQRVASSYGKQNYRQVGEYFMNGMIVYLFICISFGLVGWVVSSWVPVILTVTGGEASLLQGCFQLAVVAMVVAILNECLRSFSQALLRPAMPIIAIAAGRIIGIAATVWMLFDDFGLWAIPVGMLVAEGVILIANLFQSAYLLYKLEIKARVNYKIIKEYVQTSPVLFMSALGNALSQQADPLLITMFLSPEVTTAYMVTRRAADIVFKLMNVIVGSTMGSFSHLVGSDDDEKTKDVVKKLLIVSFLLGVIGFAGYVGTNQAFVALWVGKPFALGQNIILFIALGFFARSFRGLLGQMLYGLGDFAYPSIVILLEGLLRVVIAIVLLSAVGVIGIPLAFMFSCVIATSFLAFRLKNQLVAIINLSLMARFLFTAIVIFCLCFSLALLLEKVSVTINSWGDFIAYLTILLTVASAVCVLINWKSCHDIYRHIIK
jgi:O-antigen/teichoic acid export membrane protein